MIPVGNTRIAINLTQTLPGASSSPLTTNGLIKGDDIGCLVNGSGWAGGGGFGPLPGFIFVSGSVRSSTINLVLTETNAASTPSGFLPLQSNLTFMGTLNADGTMSGTVSDGCVRDSAGNFKQGTWAASGSQPYRKLPFLSPASLEFVEQLVEGGFVVFLRRLPVAGVPARKESSLPS